MLTNLLMAIVALQTIIVVFLLYQQNKKQAALASQDLSQQLLQQQVIQSCQRIENRLFELEKNQNESTQQFKENLLTHASGLQQLITDKIHTSRLEQIQQLAKLTDQLQQAFSEHRSRFDERQLESLKILHDTLQNGVQDTRKHVKEALTDYATELGKRVEQLTQTTDARLKEINQQVEKRLTEGFEKTNETFSNIIKRLALIDAAQQKISELSSSVMNLQEILNDKRSRGTFGEVQLSALIRNVLPESHFSFQYTLSNDKRPDCILFLPEPTGHIAIDAKFPLENYSLFMDTSLVETERQRAIRQFK